MARTRYQYVAYRLFSNTAFFVPILLLHIERKIDSPALAFVLIGIYGVTVFATEIPTGLIADSLGLRSVLAVGSLLSAIAACFLGTATSFGAFAIGQIALATALSLQSGADSAYLFALFPDKNLYESLEGSSTSAKYVGLFISSIAGSVLYVLDPRLPFVLSALVSLLAVACLVKLPVANSVARIDKDRLKVTFRQATAQLQSSRSLRLLLVFAAFSLASLSSIYWSYQFYLESIGVKVELFGTIFAMAFLASSVGAAVAKKVNQTFGYRKTFAALGILIGTVAVLMGFVKSGSGTLFPIITQFITGYMTPTLRILIQQESQPRTRATFLSLESMLHRIFMSGTVFGMGYLIREYSLSAMMMGLGLGFLLTLPAFALVVLKE
ncbi:MAG: MFS transporter [Caldilineaceae bacterium]|nr:MFS transporter [Caldilineaceae bacterium]